MRLIQSMESGHNKTSANIQKLESIFVSLETVTLQTLTNFWNHNIFIKFIPDFLLHLTVAFYSQLIAFHNEIFTSSIRIDVRHDIRR